MLLLSSKTETAPATTYNKQAVHTVDMTLYINIYEWVFAQVISVSAPCDFNRKKNKNVKESSEKKKKKTTLYMLYNSLSH